MAEDADAQAQAQLLFSELQRQHEARSALRTANSRANVSTVRAQIATLKLKSDIKRSSAFVKKLRGLSEASADSLLRDAAELNLTRYVSECVAALADAPLKLADLGAAVKVASLLHQRYEDFSPGMVRALVSSFESSYAQDDKNKMLKRRLLLRLLCELYLAGVFDDVYIIAHIIQRVAKREPIGLKKNRGMTAPTNSSTSSQQLEVPLLVSFAKSVGIEFLGIQPRKVKELIKKYANDTDMQHLVVTQSQLVPEQVQQECRRCYIEAYDMICKFYLAQHAMFLKADARNEKEEANRGEVTDEHVQELRNAKLLFEKLQTSVNALADALDRQVPLLPIEKKDDGSGNGGILVYEGENGIRHLHRDSPFDDEATRSFYEDLPDLLELVPAVVLGLTEADVAELKKKKEKGTEEEAEMEVTDEVEAIDEEGEDTTREECELDGTKDVGDKDEGEKKRKDETREASGGSCNTMTAPLSGATTSYHHQLDAFFASLEDLVNRDRCDKAAVEFCYRNSRATRNRLVKALFAVPRTHLELLAYYSRLVATLQSVLKEDIGGELVEMLVSEFHGLMKRRNQFRLESKIKNIRFLAELVKFRICPPNTGFRCLQKCFQDFQGHNVHVATTFLENCGRFLYCSKHTHGRTVNCLSVMMKLKAAKHLDPQLETLVENAYYMCKPPARVQRQVKEHDPLYLYLLKVLYQDLNGSNINKVVKTLRRYPWHEHTTCPMVLKALLKVTKGKVMQMKWICEVIKGLSRYHDDVLVLLVDDVLEYIRYSLELNDYRDHQRSLGYIKLLGELYNAGVVSMNVVVETLYLLINHSHDVLTLPQYSSDKLSALQLLEMKKRFLLVPDMRYDPRVPSEVDGPFEVFRIRLVSALIETCNGSSGNTLGIGSNHTSSNERGISRPRLGRFMIFFQRYLFSKVDVPMETEFVVYDLFELLASHLKDQFLKFETWDQVDRAVHEVLQGDLEEAERRLLKKNTALLMATNGLESVLEDQALSQPGEDDEEFLDDDEEDTEEDDDDEEEHDDEEHGEGGEQGDDEENDDENDDEDEEYDEEDEQLIIHDRIPQSEEDEEFEKAFKIMMHGTTDTRKPLVRVNVDKMAIPAVVKSSVASTLGGLHGLPKALERNGSFDGVVFRVLRRGNKGKVEARHVIVPEASSLAQHSHRQENAGKKEQSELKRLVLQNMERDDFLSEGMGPLDGMPAFGPSLPRANGNHSHQATMVQGNDSRTGFGIGSEWNNAEFGLRRGKGYRGTK
ncbi:hypothetical protein CCR75_006098 [Bremia lactucae]|uniref:MIF4G domain-containing protein n=1 Tax=Bremia lactucae TaxID=4779 RepID=A0A976III7_BRELC|nr:hypothetical protein CCR75_006098 [Bremia lactucae]